MVATRGKGRVRALPEVAGCALQCSPAARQLSDAVAMQRTQHAPDEHCLSAHPHPRQVRLVLRAAARLPLLLVQS